MRGRHSYPCAGFGERPLGPRREYDASEGRARAHPGDTQALLFYGVLSVGLYGARRREI